MFSLLLTIAAALPILQGAEQRPQVADLELRPAAVEAPDQPGGRSSSNVRHTTRPVGEARRTLSPSLSPVGSLMAVRGQESNHVMGIGIVTGLAGTGDSNEAARQLLRNLLLTRNINLDLQTLSSKNIAVVHVEADLPAGLEPGRRLDVRVSTIGDAKSLQGGILTLTELTDITGRTVYATASGPITVGGFLAEGAASSAVRNHVTVGTLPGGGKVERKVATTLVSEHGYIYLDAMLGHDTLGNIVRVVEAIEKIYPEAAEPSADGKTIKVRVPHDLPARLQVAYLDSILRMEIEADNLARVIVNERTGVIVMGGDVRLRPGAIAHGNLTVTIAETPEVSQPGPLSEGQTEVVERTELDVEEQSTGLVLVPGAVTLQEVVDVLNVLGTSPRDMISILQAMSQGGLLVAEVRSM